MPATYASLAEGKAELSAGSTSRTVDDRIVQNYLRAVTARIDRQFQAKRPLFFPYIEARPARIDNTHVNSLDGTLALDSPLLSLTSAVVGSQTLAAGLYPSAYTPARTLQLSNYGSSWFDYCAGSGYPSAFGTLTGVWGIHRDYANAWLKVDDAAAIATTTALTFTVADVDGADPNNRLPRISAGNLIKIDDEYMEVVVTDTGTNTVTVVRGAHGSTAATHLVGADVYVWQVEDTIRRACARQAGMLYARLGAYESAVVTDIGVTNYPSDLLHELREIVTEYAYE